MSYELTEEQRMLQETVARLAKEQIAPEAGKRDEKAEFSWEMVEILRDNGLFGADFPEKYRSGTQRGRPVFGYGQTACRRNRHESDHRCGSATGRVRIHEGISAGTDDARR